MARLSASGRLTATGRLAATRSNLNIAVGSYAGTGVAQTITGVGFTPTVVIVKGGANHTVFRTRTMVSNTAAYMATALANLAGSIQELVSDGFIVGTDVTANAAATTYYYIALRGAAAQNYLRAIKYVGDGNDDRNLNAQGIYFQPDILWAKRDGASNPAWRNTSMASNSSAHFNGLADAANELQDFIANGFQVGTSLLVNGAASTYHAVALKALAGTIAYGTYTGTGVSGNAITGLGFSPDLVILKNSASAAAGVLRTSTMTTTTSFPMGASSSTSTDIISLDSNGFTLGSAAASNSNGVVFWWFAVKAGSFNVPITRLTA